MKKKRNVDSGEALGLDSEKDLKVSPDEEGSQKEPSEPETVESFPVETPEDENIYLLALFVKRYVYSKPLSVNTYQTHNQVFPKDTYILDQELIKELINLDAPIEIYQRVE